jgi:hypothetical protein
VQEIMLGAAPVTLAYFPLAHDAFNQHPTRNELFYGLSNGDVGQLFLDAASHHYGSLLPNTSNRGAATQIFSAFDMTQNGMNEVAVGRDDGSFEVYDMDSNAQLQLVRPQHDLCQMANILHAQLCHTDSRSAVQRLHEMCPVSVC